MQKKSLITFLYYQLDNIKSLVLNPISSFEESNYSLIRRLVRNRVMRLEVARKDIIQHNKSPFISIILPVLNSEKTVLTAINSVQRQTYENWELIVIDDGSNDTTVEGVSAIVKKDHRIKLLCNAKTMGVAYTRNVGLQHAKGRYLTFHDADDRSHPQRLEFQLAELCSTPTLKVVTFLYCRETKDGEALVTNRKVRWNRVSGMMFGREVFEKLGYFKQLHISEDSEYHERIKAVYGNKSCKKIKKLLYYALFDISSLLFSNANIEIKGGRVEYKIKEKEQQVLEKCRAFHNELRKGSVDCYQSFEQSR